MTQLHQLSYKEIDSFFAEPRVLYFFTFENKLLTNAKYDAIGLINPQNAVLFLEQYFKNNPAQMEKCGLVKANITDLSFLSLYYTHSCFKNTYIGDLGFIKNDDVQQASMERMLVQKLQHKVDNDYITWIGFSDGTEYQYNNCRVLFIDEMEAERKAKEIGGHLGKINLLQATFSETISTNITYAVDNTLIPGFIIRNALMRRFQNTMLNFETVKRFIDKGLKVYAGTNDKEEFELFVCNSLSAFFTDRADESLIHPLIQQHFPTNSTFYNVPKREALYQFAQSQYISFDCMYHCSLETFENAIMGRNDYKKWNNRDKANKVQQLFQAQNLYIILSRQDYQEQYNCSYPSIVNSNRKRVWLFDNYGKAVNFCQQKDRCIKEGVPAIGLISSNIDGLDLYSTLSLLTYQDVLDVELNPLEDDRMILPIASMFKVMNLTPKKKNEITKIQLGEEDYRNKKPWIFNDIMLT